MMDAVGLLKLSAALGLAPACKIMSALGRLVQGFLISCSTISMLLTNCSSLTMLVDPGRTTQITR